MWRGPDRILKGYAQCGFHPGRQWGAISVQDIGLVIPNAVCSVTALNDGAMGDILLVH